MNHVSRARLATIAALGVALSTAGPAFSFGPNADPDSPAVTNCAGPGENYESGVVAKQTENEIQAGGGPKSDAPAPANCDHFWQTPPENSGAGAIGNGWPPK